MNQGIHLVSPYPTSFEIKVRRKGDDADEGWCAPVSYYSELYEEGLEVVDGDRVTWNKNNTRIYFDRRMATPALFEFTSPTGTFTRQQIYHAIWEGFARIYEVEDFARESETTMPLEYRELAKETWRHPDHILKMLSREYTHGPYGIWGCGDAFVIEGVRRTDNEFFLDIGT